MANLKPRVGEFWKNNRRGFEYRIMSLPFWSDSKDENDLEQWVVMRNLKTQVDYVRSVESFMGVNRHGHVRFSRVGMNGDGD